MNIPHATLIVVGLVFTTACRSPLPPPAPAATNAPVAQADRHDPQGLASASQPAGVDFTTDLEAAIPAANDGPQWRHVATFYAWVPNLKGDVTVRGLDAEPSVSRSDVLDDLDIAFSGRYEVQPPDSDWSFFGDVFHARISDDASAGTAAVGRIDADAEARMTFVEAGAIMHFWESDETLAAYERETAQSKLDFYGGARYSRMRIDLDLKAKAVGFKRSFDHTGDWTDPFLGARVRHGLTPRLWLIARGDIGGFDVGSHRTWTATGTLQYMLSDVVAVGAGWRIMDIDYDDGPDADIRMSGPFVTLSYDF